MRTSSQRNFVWACWMHGVKDERIPLSHGILGQETNGAVGC